MKESYSRAEIEIEYFEAEDVVITSGSPQISFDPTSGDPCFICYF